MIHSLGVVPAPACFLTRTWFVCLQSLRRSPFQEVTLAPQLLAFPKAFGKDFPRFALRCTEAPRVYSALRSAVASPNAGTPHITLRLGHTAPAVAWSPDFFKDSS